MIVLILSHKQHAGFEDGNEGGSIVVSLSSAPSAEASAFGENSSELDTPEATNQSEARTTPEIQELPKEIELEEVKPEVTKEAEIVEPSPIISQPEQEPQELTEPVIIPEPEIIPEQEIDQPEIIEPAEITEPIVQPAPSIETVQKPKAKPKPPVQKSVKIVEKKSISKPLPKVTNIPVPTQKANTGKSKETIDATNIGAQSEDNNSSGQQGINPNKSKNTGNTNQTANNRGAGQKATGDYWKAVQIHLARNKRYPRKAKRRQMQGEIMIQLTLFSSGKVESYKILESSGFPLLDKAAIKMINKSAPFPPFPASITAAQMSRRIPVVFNMK
ncbi:energy transducer TonB [Kiloniella majae]|uniref:energy transducer TonB n=1 Tax=Kiloniella majae TaxID=1938558 RepID=UPI000F7A498B|nr:energy transducer TonB [Kiloniella majae]